MKPIYENIIVAICGFPLLTILCLAVVGDPSNIKYSLISALILATAIELFAIPTWIFWIKDKD